MARYFKVIEINREEFIAADGRDLDCVQCTCIDENNIMYVAVDENETDRIDIDLIDFT